MLLHLLFFTHSIVADSSGNPLLLKEVRPDGQCVIVCEQGCRPGLTVLFPTNAGSQTAVKLLQKTSTKHWAAMTLDKNLPKMGSSSEFYDPLPALPDGRSKDFWLELSNQCQQAELSPRIYLLGERSQGEIRQEDFIQLMLETVTDQYMALLEIGPDQNICVWYPHDTIRLRTKVIAGNTPLTFDAKYLEPDSDEKFHSVMPALIRTGISANPPGKTHFVVLTSDEPRPLSDWLPNDMAAVTLISGTKRTRIKPWQVGPGFFDLDAPNPLMDTDADNLDCQTWAITSISFSVTKK